MATVYICDACGEKIENPYRVKMKEFYLNIDLFVDIYPIRRKSKKKIHLCDTCFKNLKKLGGTT